MLRCSTRLPETILAFLTCLLLAANANAGAADDLLKEVGQALVQFDQCRMLSMRAVKNAQDVKTAYLYGSGFGLQMPEAISEDLLLEGEWLFDYLYSMDLTSAALLSYASAANHPNLQDELAAFRAFLPEAAAKTLAYHEKTARMLADAVAQVNAAAQAKAAFKIETLPARPFPGVPPSVQNAAGDGFQLGWAMPVRPDTVSHVLALHGYEPDWMLRKAQEAGVDFFYGEDFNVFEWSDVEKQPGQFDWSRADETCNLLKQHDLGILLRLPSATDSPPAWLRRQLGDQAVLVGIDGKPVEVDVTKVHDSYFFGIKNAAPKKNPINMFNAQAADAFGNYERALLGRIKQNGVRIVGVDLEVRGLPWYGGEQATARFRKWLADNKIDPRARWGADFDVAAAAIPGKVDPLGVTDPAQKRMLADVIRWREQEYIDYLRPQVQAIREFDPNLPVGTLASEVAEANESMAGRHNERLVRELQIVPIGMSLENIWDNLRRSYSPGHFSVALTHAGAGDAYSQYAMSGYAHDACTLYSLPQVRGFIWGEQVFYPDLRWEFTSMLGWRRFHERAQGMAPEMLNTRPAPQVAMLWSDTSGKFQSFIRDYVGGTYGFNAGQANYNKIGCIGWGRILDSIGLSQDMVTEDQVRAGKLERYQVLVMPSVQALPADVVEKIRRFVSGGGILVATSAAALYGDDMEQKGPGQLADVLGADFESFIGRSMVAESPLTAPRKEGVDGLWRPNKQTRDLGHDTMRTLFCTFKPREGAQVLEVFSSDRQPSVILNKFGKGQALAIGYPVGRESFLSYVYYQHYGSNWPDAPQGPIFQQNVFYWVELLLRKIGFKNDAVVVDEMTPRSTSYDAAYSEGTWPRATQRYRDYFWRRAAQSDNTSPAPRSAEVIIRRAFDNPTTYVEIFNREGAYGLHPGTLELEFTSKQITVQLNRNDVTHAYDISLGCAVPFEKRGGATAVQTLIEPSSARMLAVSNDGTIRRYEGNRKHGGLTDGQLRQQIAQFAGKGEPQQLVVIGIDQIKAFLAERGPKGITISAEEPIYLPAAQKLADAIRKKYGKEARITRTTPRIGYTASWGHRMGNEFMLVEQPDIVLGNRDTSGYVAMHGTHPGRGGHTVPLPIMTSLSFPGPGRAAIVLLRPYTKVWESGLFPADTPRPDEKPAPTAMVVGASDAAGLEQAVDKLIKILPKAAP